MKSGFDKTTMYLDESFADKYPENNYPQKFIYSKVPEHMHGPCNTAAEKTPGDQVMSSVGMRK
jgi:hypothetical protein